MKLGDKVRKTRVGMLWSANRAIDKAEKAEKKKKRRGLIAFTRLIQAFMTAMTVYIFSLFTIVFLTPTIVSYLGGLARITKDTDIFVTISTWVFPSIMALLCLFALYIVVIKFVVKAWGNLFNTCVDSIRRKAEKQNEKNQKNIKKSVDKSV